MRTVVPRHRNIFPRSQGRFPSGANALRFTDRVLGILRTGGLPNTLAVSAVDLLWIVVNGLSS
jgi:tetracycline repressor-like protein